MFQSRLAREKWDELNDAIDEAQVRISCRESDPDAWFPEKDSTIGNKYTLAQRVCAKCPVRDLCLEFALVNEEQHGVWGGMTPKERQRLRGRGRPRA